MKIFANPTFAVLWIINIVIVLINYQYIYNTNSNYSVENLHWTASEFAAFWQQEHMSVFLK